MNKKKLTRQDWIKKLELMIINLAMRGEEYAHVYVEMEAETNKLLEGDLGIPKEQSEEKEAQEKIIFKEATMPYCNLFIGVNVRETIRVLATEKVPIELLRSKLNSGLLTFNEMKGVNHIYESHKDEYGVSFKRVG